MFCITAQKTSPWLTSHLYFLFNCIYLFILVYIFYNQCLMKICFILYWHVFQDPDSQMHTEYPVPLRKMSEGKRLAKGSLNLQLNVKFLFLKTNLNFLSKFCTNARVKTHFEYIFLNKASLSDLTQLTSEFFIFVAV